MFLPCRGRAYSLQRLESPKPHEMLTEQGGELEGEEKRRGRAEKRKSREEEGRKGKTEGERRGRGMR